MSTNKEFDAIVAELDIPDNVVCECCQTNIATVRVKYACDHQEDLLCAKCMVLFGAHTMQEMARALMFGRTLAHKCGTPLGNMFELAAHIAPENLDGTPIDPEAQGWDELLK
jgi:hypothetical protein